MEQSRLSNAVAGHQTEIIAPAATYGWMAREKKLERADNQRPINFKLLSAVYRSEHGAEFRNCGEEIGKRPVGCSRFGPRRAGLQPHIVPRVLMPIHRPSGSSLPADADLPSNLAASD
ncbi:hypothetical protein KM043_006900 [Ampulex compressa]|nr:hypothetical protein KM043_006900 [Ampulex compressa]